MKLLNGLNPRERLMVLGGGGVLICLALWLYVWQPLVAAQALQSDRIARYLTVLEVVRTTPNSIPAPRAASVSTAPLATRVTQSAEAAGILLARLDPDGPRLRVTVAKTGYDAAVNWIAQLETTVGLRAVSIEMSRLTEPGQVTMRVSLEDAG